MAGMPSARGLEWRTDGHSRIRYDNGYQKINWKKKEIIVEDTAIQKCLPNSCSQCGIRNVDVCPDSCAHGSKECKKKLGL